MVETKQIHTTLSIEYYDKLKFFAKYFKTQKKVIEIALDALDEKINLKEVSDEDSYWLRMKDHNAVFLSKKSFNYLLEGKIENFSDKKSCRRALEIITKESLEDLPLEKIVKHLAFNYKANNWFERITVEYPISGDVTLTFYHYMGYHYSEILSKYFVNFFEDLNHNCKVSLTTEFFTITLQLSESF